MQHNRVGTDEPKCISIDHRILRHKNLNAGHFEVVRDVICPIAQPRVGTVFDLQGIAEHHLTLHFDDDHPNDERRPKKHHRDDREANQTKHKRDK
jgi:hypothetical protein